MSADANKEQTHDDIYDKLLDDMRTRISTNGQNVPDTEFKKFVVMSLDLIRGYAKTSASNSDRIDELEKQTGGMPTMTRILVEYPKALPFLALGVFLFLFVLFQSDMRGWALEQLGLPVDLLVSGTPGLLLASAGSFVYGIYNTFGYIRKAFERSQKK